jgi:uncharacterized protein
VVWGDEAPEFADEKEANAVLGAIMGRYNQILRQRSKRDGQLLLPILALCGDENGLPLLDMTPDEEDRFMEEADELIPACVTAIAAYWRGKEPKQISMPLPSGSSTKPARTPTKVGRNNPCPCSGKKFKNAAASCINSTAIQVPYRMRTISFVLGTVLFS